MTTIELEEIKIAREAARKQIKYLENREMEIRSRIRKSHDATIQDDVLLMPDITESEINYTLGQSAGFLAGFQAAINFIVDALNNQYREIPITMDELYMLVELGAEKERAYLKDFKSKKIAEKSGWEFMLMNRCPVWQKKEQEEAESEETEAQG